MRVHIITDMEGVSGIVKGAQTHGGAPMYEEGRKLYTEEINAAVRGAKAAGATEIVVMDCHGAGKEWSFNSLVPDLLDPACEWVVQDNWTEYTEFLEEGCDAALLVGHARAGRHAPGRYEPHRLGPWTTSTSPSTARSSARPGSTPRSAAPGDCPVLLVTGDDVAATRGGRCSGRVTTVAVKRGLGALRAADPAGAGA